MSLFSELKRRNVIRVAIAYLAGAWLLSEVATTLFPLFGFGETPARIVVILLAIGFPLFLVFSWVFEFTPEGLKLEKDIDQTASITHRTGKQLDRVIIVLLALALGYFAFDKFVLDPAQDVKIAETARQEGRSEALIESYGDKSIAVLPFVNMSDDAGNEYFSDGITEELLNLLTRVRELRVASRSSSFAFKGQGKDVSDIAERLNVAYVLAGSVRKSGRQVRVTTQLIDAKSDTQIWSESYDRRLDEIFAVQDDVAAAVVNELKINLIGAAPKVQRTSTEVHTMFLQARHMLRQETKTGFLSGVELMEKALTIDPDYSPAWGSLSVAYGNASTSYMPGDEASIKSKAAIKELLRTDPDSAFAYSMLGHFEVTEGDLKSAGQYYSKALSLAPNNDGVLNGVATYLAWMGRWEEAAELLRTLSGRYPLNTTYLGNLGIVYIFGGRFEEAQIVTDTALALAPGSFLSGWNRLFLLIFHTKEYGKALESCEYLGTESGSASTMLFCQAIIHPKLALEDKGDAALASLVQEFDEGVCNSIWLVPCSYGIARIYALNNQPDLAFKWLETSYQTSGTHGLSLAWNDWLLRSLHADSRWQPFLQKAGVSEEQMRSLEFEILVQE